MGRRYLHRPAGLPSRRLALRLFTLRGFVMATVTTYAISRQDDGRREALTPATLLAAIRQGRASPTGARHHFNID